MFSKETELPCGEAATQYMRLPLCAEHIDSVRDLINSRARASAVQTAKYHPLESFPGLCYIVLLPDGLIKIGYSNTNKLLEERFGALGRLYGAAVVPLLVIPGGFVAEAVLHARFNAYRVPGNGERFRHSPELAEYIASSR